MSCHQHYSGRFYKNHHNDHILIAVRDMPAGAVLKRSDLTLEHGWVLFHGQDACLLPEDVFGHATLRPLVKGDTVHAADIDGALKQLPGRCLEDVADGWSGWQRTSP
jgi:flagella basal body P-ring formation protein FlgA